MELLKFYLINIFEFLAFPEAKEICGSNPDFSSKCNNIINFCFYLTPIILLINIFLFSNLKRGFKFFIFSISLIISLFIFSDRALERIADVSNYGFENFIILFNFWCFASFILLVLANIFSENLSRFFHFSLILSGVFSFLFIFFGRGSIEHIASLSGTIFNGFSLASLSKGFLFKQVILYFIFSVIFGFIILILEWVKSGEIIPNIFFRSFKIFGLFLCSALIILISIPFGILVNNNDVEYAKNYIEELKPKIDKYYYENGEYPKVLDDIIDFSKPNPFLLERHEYYSYGIRGTYYFSRSDKYCIIFQNPSIKFGYFSVTSGRDWQFTYNQDSFDNIFINACDESSENSEGLVSGYLGMETPDDYLNSTAIEFNVPNVKPISKEDTETLHKKIIDYGKEDPEIFKYYRNFEGEK
ncbi:MAG: hypothetical protein SFT90_02080 [Rickettsiales bacterium]|nr:hypothetical protein [Rickettsiales bacterium]